MYAVSQVTLQDALKAGKEGDLEYAKELYAYILRDDPQNIEAFCGLSMVYKKLKKYIFAESTLESALCIDPQNYSVLLNLANLYRDMRKHKKALLVYAKAIKIDPHNAHGYNNLAINYEMMGAFDKAIDTYKSAICVDVKFVKAYNNIGVLLYKQKRYKSAVEIFKMALNVDKSYKSTYVNFGAALNKLKRYDEAVDILQKAIALDPLSAGAYANLGNVYNKINRHTEARKCHEMALRKDPDSASNHANLGISYKNLSLFEMATEEMERAIEINPDFVNAHFDLSTLYLLQGNFLDGFREYEWRFKKSEMIGAFKEYPEIYQKPIFTLDSDAKNKKLLVYSEQGFGDNIQFVRYLKVLRKKYKTLQIILQCRAELKELFDSLAYVDKVVVRGDDIGDFDYRIAIMSLPYLLKVTYKYFSHEVPYIRAFKKDFKFRPRRGKLKIGIVWGGSNTNENHNNRRLDLRKFAPLINHEKVQIYSLQVGEDREDIKKYGFEKDIIDLSDELKNFKLTASAIKHLDLLISSDTSVVHLAGAMNHQCWVMLQKIPDWRWMIDKEETIWYPSLRLFRQDRKGQWDSVYKSVFKALTKKYKIKFEEAK